MSRKFLTILFGKSRYYVMKKNRYSYHELLEIFTEDKIKERFFFVKNKANAFLEAAGYSDSVQCNDRILMHVIVDYFSDIVRLKNFHDIEHTNKDKITAYLLHWILRRKPLQFIDLDIENEKDIFVNERFALSILINECIFADFEEDIPVLSEDDMKKFDTYIELVQYYFQYRECNAQVIELVIASFRIGRLTVQKDIRKK